jgi:hypothetical protein
MALAAAYASSADLTRPSHRIGERLDAASRAIDGHFLKLGRGLGQALERLGALVSALEQMQATLDPRMIGDTAAELRDAASALSSLPEHHATRSDNLQRLAGAAERLAGSIETMRRTLAYLRVFAINIKIAAGGLGPAGEEFGAFAQEICDCIALGQTRLETFEHDLAALRGGFKAAFAQEKTLTDHCAGLLPAVPDGLIANAMAMVAHHENIGRAAGETAALVREIHKKTGSALGALQIGDITRQRIEHVSEALDMLDQVQDATPDQKARIAALIHKLLEAQLRDAAEDFHRDVGRIGAAMRGIADDARDILRLRDLALGRAEDGDKGFLRQIETHVAHALGLVADMAEADRRALVVGASVSAAAGDLSQQITELRSVNTDVQYMALNATLRCGRLGDAGKPLTVIAVELRVQAGQMDASARESLAGLEVLTLDAGAMSEDAATQAGDVVGVVGDNLTRAAERLRAAGDKVEADLADAAREGAAVVEDLRRASAQMDFQDDIGAILHQAASGLAHDADDLALSPQDAAPLSALLAKIAKRYTMKQERDLHRQLTQAFGLDEPNAAAAPEPSNNDLASVLF